MEELLPCVLCYKTLQPHIDGDVILCVLLLLLTGGQTPTPSLWPMPKANIDHCKWLSSKRLRETFSSRYAGKLQSERETLREGQSCNQEYQDLRLHELQLSTAQRMSYCYARAQSAQLEIREREREHELRDREERAGEETAASEPRASRLQLDPHTHTITHTPSPPLSPCRTSLQLGSIMSGSAEGVFLSPPRE